MLMNRQFFLPVEVSANMAHNLETADDTFMLSLRSADYRVQPQIRHVTRTTLIVQGYQVSDARTGNDALDLVRSEKYDLTLLDVFRCADSFSTSLMVGCPAVNCVR
jgi:PleD family two-component response regulator